MSAFLILSAGIRVDVSKGVFRMSAVKVPTLLPIVLIVLLLYWVVQDPVGAADMIRGVFEWAISFLQLVADRVVQFLSALV